MPSSKIAEMLNPGDVVQLELPDSRGRVISNHEAKRTKMGPDGEQRLARIIRLEMIDGHRSGKKDFVFAHPADRVRLA